MRNIISAMIALLFAGAAATAEETTTSLLKNGSFEDQGEKAGNAASWDDDTYTAGIRTDEKASEGKHSVRFIGAGKSNLALRQELNLDELLRQCSGKLQDAKLDVSCDVYVESFTQGAIRPLHFIITDADGKSRYPGKTIAPTELKLNQWNTVRYTLDLSQYVGMKGIVFYILGWKDGEKFFVGTFYVDNVRINAAGGGGSKVGN